MRIARVLTRLNLGGPARQVLASDPLLRERGHTLRLFAGRPELGEGDLFEEAVARGLDVVRVPGLVRGLAPARDLRARRELVRALREFAPDVLHTHASKAGTLGRGALAKLPDEARIARVHTFHGHVLEGYFPGPVSKHLIAHERKLAANTDRILAVSHATAEDLLRLGVVTERKLVVVPPGIELEPLLALAREAHRAPGPVRTLLGVGPEAVLIGVLGRLAEVKRHDWAVDVFALLARRYPNLHLAFVGDGSERKRLEQRIRSLPDGGATRVHMLGNRTDVPEVLADLDGVLLTSRSEGLPVALIEAAAAALPVVATDVGGVAELVAHERTGFLGTSVDELAFGLSKLLDDGELRLGMGRRGRLRVRERHGAARLAERLEEVYRAAIEERTCAS